MEENDNIYNTNLDEDLYDKNLKEKKMQKDNQLWLIILVTSNVVLIGIIALILINLLKEDDEDKIQDPDDQEKPYEEEEIEHFEGDGFFILKYNKDFIKPNVSLNFKFELVKTQNNMTGLIINDPYADNIHIQFQVENGYLTDTVGGLAHLDEHMIFGGSEKYKYYSMERTLGGTFGFMTNAMTDNTYQAYYISTINNYKFEKGVDVLLDSFRYPTYDEKVIKNEVQSINSEFYLNYRYLYSLLENIIRQLSKQETSFNGFGIGNNETLKPNENKELSKKLKGYHMLVNRPENFFFVFYSNLSMTESENYIKNNFNYQMHEFSDDEIDVQDKKKLEQNIKDLKAIEIFDDNLYLHGFYFNSEYKLNLLFIFFHIGNVDYNDLQFDIVEYYDFLFSSKYLIDILKKKKYIILTEKIYVYSFLLMDNNNVIEIEVPLTEKGTEEIEQVLLIIYKYVELMKQEGYKKKYFDDFIRYKNMLNIQDFSKTRMIYMDTVSTFITMTHNFRLYGDHQIFTSGMPTEKNYDEKKLKDYLNRIAYEKSFFGVNINENLSGINTFLNEFSHKNLNYYKIDYYLGKYPTDFKDKINISKFDGLKFRDVNPYFSNKFGKVIPCYKKVKNKCEERNEFDFEKFDEYNGTLLEEKKEGYKTYYQIEKSSESYLVFANIKLNIKEIKLFNDFVYNEVLMNYIVLKFKEINEINSFGVSDFYNTSIGFMATGYTDTIQKIIKDGIDYIKQDRKEEEFEYVKNVIKKQLNIQFIDFTSYSIDICESFLNKGMDMYYNPEENIKKLDNMTFETFNQLYDTVFNSITSIEFKIAGNIDKKLVQELHNYIKARFDVHQESFKIFKANQNEPISNSSFVIEYYQKSDYPTSIDNSIIVVYEYPKKYTNYMNVLSGCLRNIAMIYLRFNLTNTYSPMILLSPKFISIGEQGRYKEVTEMEDDINKVLFEMIKGNIQCEDYEDIVKSYKIEMNQTAEKNYNSMFYTFVFGKFDPMDWEGEEEEEEEEAVFPDNFNAFVSKLSPIFTNPRRYSILIARKDLSDDDYRSMIEKRSDLKYLLNESVIVNHTEEIDYLNKTSI